MPGFTKKKKMALIKAIKKNPLMKPATKKKAIMKIKKKMR